MGIILGKICVEIPNTNRFNLQLIKKITMTAPSITTSSEKIEMTAPVITKSGDRENNT
ncbi:hypothetical protein HAX54_050341, partial [Datura stramonium]|nr:hypothetical protein [Datura stramonium]